jgi:hypothetical protein
MNRSKDLRDLFRQSLIRKRTEVGRRVSPMYNASTLKSYIANARAVNGIMVYFYEWSDINRVPRTFHDMEELERFLRASGIYMELYQKEIVANLATVYMTCYKDTKNLNVRSTYAALVDSMKSSVNVGEGQKRDITPMLPFKENPSAIHRPMMVEPEGRWDADGSYCGYWY